MSDEISELVDWQISHSEVAIRERREAEALERVLTGDISARLWGAV